MTTTKSTGKDAASGGFSAEERAAMKERAEELKAESGGKRSKKDGEADVLAKIEAMPDADRKVALRVHEIVKATAPELKPKTWYGMPAYARDGKVVVYFQDANRFKARYATLGFDESAHLDEGEMWPTSFAITKLTPAVEKRIADLVKKAVG